MQRGNGRLINLEPAASTAFKKKKRFHRRFAEGVDISSFLAIVWRSQTEAIRSGFSRLYTPTLTSRKWFSPDPTKDGPAFWLLPRRSAKEAMAA